VELCGLVILWLGILFAGACCSKIASLSPTQGDKDRMTREVDGMKTRLLQAKVPDDQIEGLLAVYRRAFAYRSMSRSWQIFAFLSIAGLCVGLLGLCLTLWSRQRRLAALFVDGMEKAGLITCDEKARVS
jgi:hypothetical protein